MTPELRETGRLAYRAFIKQAADCADWDELPDATREAWGEVAVALATYFKARTEDAFFGYVRTF